MCASVGLLFLLLFWGGVPFEQPHFEASVQRNTQREVSRSFSWWTFWSCVNTPRLCSAYLASGCHLSFSLHVPVFFLLLWISETLSGFCLVDLYFILFQLSPSSGHTEEISKPPFASKAKIPLIGHACQDSWELLYLWAVFMSSSADVSTESSVSMLHVEVFEHSSTFPFPISHFVHVSFIFVPFWEHVQLRPSKYLENVKLESLDSILLLVPWPFHLSLWP